MIQPHPYISTQLWGTKRIDPISMSSLGGALEDHQYQVIQMPDLTVSDAVDIKHAAVTRYPKNQDIYPQEANVFTDPHRKYEISGIHDEFWQLYQHPQFLHDHMQHQYQHLQQQPLLSEVASSPMMPPPPPQFHQENPLLHQMQPQLNLLLNPNTSTLNYPVYGYIQPQSNLIPVYSHAPSGNHKFFMNASRISPSNGDLDTDHLRIRDFLRSLPDEPPISSKKPLYKCPVAGCQWGVQQFAKKSDLRKHCFDKHLVRGKIASGIDPMTANKIMLLLHKCPIPSCGKHYSRSDSLKRHIKLIHQRPTSRFNKRLRQQSSQQSMMCYPVHWLWYYRCPLWHLQFENFNLRLLWASEISLKPFCTSFVNRTILSIRTTPAGAQIYVDTAG